MKERLVRGIGGRSENTRSGGDPYKPWRFLGYLGSVALNEEGSAGTPYSFFLMMELLLLASGVKPPGNFPPLPQPVIQTFERRPPRPPDVVLPEEEKTEISELTVRGLILTRNEWGGPQETTDFSVNGKLKISAVPERGLLVIQGEEGLAQKILEEISNASRWEAPIVQTTSDDGAVVYYEPTSVQLTNVSSLEKLGRITGNQEGIFLAIKWNDNERVTLVRLERYDVEAQVTFRNEGGYLPCEMTFLMRSCLMGLEELEKIVGPLPPLEIAFKPGSRLEAKKGGIYVPPETLKLVGPIEATGIAHETVHASGVDMSLPKPGNRLHGYGSGEGLAMLVQVRVLEKLGINPEAVFPLLEKIRAHYEDYNQQIQEEAARGIGFYDGSREDVYQRYLIALVAAEEIQKRYPDFYNYIREQYWRRRTLTGNSNPPTPEEFLWWVQKRYGLEGEKFIRAQSVFWMGIGLGGVDISEVWWEILKRDWNWVYASPKRNILALDSAVCRRKQI